jgi:hypothetical protein
VKLFDGARPQIYIHGAKLRRDKKTGKRLWGLTLIITLNPELVDACGGPIEQAWLYILTLDNQADEVTARHHFTRLWAEFKERADEIQAEQANTQGGAK